MAEASADRYAHLTPNQRLAIRTVDTSVLVSAAAGSGKTTVLAERCASLVCDHRCPVDQLLVVTFTDAAAGEMRTRIESAIRKRLADHPEDSWLREQLYLVDNAGISTIHAFCRSLIRQWFPQAGIDPQAAVLSSEEATLLQHEVLDELFAELYGQESELADKFRQWVDDYGAGEDNKLAQAVLGLHKYLASLPDPAAWKPLPLTPANRHK